jgi:hypothetical protein
MAVPPLDAENQLTVPEVAVADRLTEPPVVHFWPLVTPEIYPPFTITVAAVETLV